MMFLVGGVAFSEEVVDKTLAIVNGEPLMSSEFEKIAEPMVQQYMAMTPVTEQSDSKINELKNQILEQRIDQMVLTQEAKKQKIKVVKRELDEAINQVKKRFPNDETFQSELKNEGLTQIQSASGCLLGAKQGRVGVGSCLQKGQSACDDEKGSQIE